MLSDSNKVIIEIFDVIEDVKEVDESERGMLFVIVLNIYFKVVVWLLLVFIILIMEGYDIVIFGVFYVLFIF